MLEFKAIDITSNEAIYDYYVEGHKDQRDTISINLETEKCDIVNLANGDDFKWYAFHLMRRLEEMASKHEFIDNGLVMWYQSDFIFGKALFTMQRDMDLVRDLLKLAASSNEPRVNAYALSNDSRSRELIAYHVRIMTQAGLIESYVKPDDLPAPGACFIMRLTWCGNDFLDAVNSDTVWNEVKKKLASSIGSVSFNVLTSLVSSVSMRFLGL